MLKTEQLAGGVGALRFGRRRIVDKRLSAIWWRGQSEFDRLIRSDHSRKTRTKVWWLGLPATCVRRFGEMTVIPSLNRLMAEPTC